MESLRDVLQEYSGAALTLGSNEATKSAKNSRQALQKALTDLSRRNERYFVIGMVMAVVLFAALLVVGFLQLNSPPLPGKIIPPVFGTSAAVVVWRMFRTWREKNYTDCLLALVPNVDEATLKTIVNALVKKV